MVGQTLCYSTEIALECAFTNGKVARHMQNIREEHWKAMDRFVGYIKGKKKHELIVKIPRELRTVSLL